MIARPVHMLMCAKVGMLVSNGDGAVQAIAGPLSGSTPSRERSVCKRSALMTVYMMMLCTIMHTEIV
jgi:hypothetical protein